MYGLFKRPRDAAPGARWERVMPFEGSKDAVVRAAQDILIRSVLECWPMQHEVRPLPKMKGQ